MTSVAPDAPDVAPARRASGLSLALVSAAAFGLSGSLARGLIEIGWTPGSAVTVRVLVAALVLAVPAVLAIRGRWFLLRRKVGLIVAYGVFAVAATQLCFFYAVGEISVGVALLIEYTAPVAVVGWMWLRHHQRPHRLTFLGAIVAAVGLVLVLDLLGSSASVNTAGVLWSLGAMVGAASYFVLSADQNTGLPPLVLAWAGLLLGGVLLALAGAIGVLPMRFVAEPVTFAVGTVPWWVPVLGLCLVTAALAYTTGIAATRLLGSRMASFLALTEVLAALAYAWLLLAELPTMVQLLGGLLILTGVVVVKLGERRVPVVTSEGAVGLAAPLPGR